tara:strand:- start:47 stop:457 length:411 start_codon:yes stop_codon:yes gene_type:complete
MSTLAVGTIKSISSAAPVFQNTSGTEKGQLAKSWIAFNGQSTVSISDSFNVTSLTDNATGDYSINMANAMSNANYAVCSNAGLGSSRFMSVFIHCRASSPFFQNPTTTVYRIVTSGDQGTGDVQDPQRVACAVFGD